MYVFGDSFLYLNRFYIPHPNIIMANSAGMDTAIPGLVKPNSGNSCTDWFSRHQDHTV
jgi:hypothetical protein